MPLHESTTEVDVDALEAWASGPMVCGHVHSMPVEDPYELSLVQDFGAGSEAPDGWTLRLLSAAGLKSKPSPNQDAFSYTKLQSGWVVCIACDGHGESGEVVSERAARTIPFFLSHHMPLLGMEGALREAFLLAQADLERCFAPVQWLGGATAAVSCIHPELGEAWVAHAGDSTFVLGDLATGEAVFHTDEHKAHDPTELKRLRGCKAQVISRRYPDGEVVSRVFVPRSGMPGLAMSRSLGDGCVKKYGVVAEPEVRNVTEIWRSCAAPVAVLGSDGLFDYVRVPEVVATLQEQAQAGRGVDKTALKLLRRAQNLWIDDQGDYCDDITCLVMGPTPGPEVMREQ